MITIVVFRTYWLILTGPHLKEDGEKADYHFYLELLTIKNHAAIEIPPYYLPPTSATRQSHNLHLYSYSHLANTQLSRKLFL